MLPRPGKGNLHPPAAFLSQPHLVNSSHPGHGDTPKFISACATTEATHVLQPLIDIPDAIPDPGAGGVNGMGLLRAFPRCRAPRRVPA